MVTIEQKLTLFSKLLQQDIKENLDKKAEELEEEYKTKKSKSKAKVDKQAEEIVSQAVRRGESKKIELISKGKMATKREGMLAKEKYIHIFMEHLRERVISFTKQAAYKDYLKRLIKECTSLGESQNNIAIYITQNDYSEYKEMIEEEFEKIGLNKEQLSFCTEDESMLGGIIINDPTLNTRIDLSMRGVIEESKDYIIESIFKAIGEVGGPVE